MGAPTKPGVDWSKIEREWLAGESPYALAKRHPVTKQAIQQRRDREGWNRDDPQSAAKLRRARQVAELPSIKELENPQTYSHKMLAGHGNRTVDKALKILELIEAGLPRQVAARGANMTPETLNNWLEADPAFLAMIEATEIGELAGYYDDIRKAGKRGDWRASETLLKANPITRPMFGGEAQRTGPSITVVLNIPDPGNPESPKPLIDISPTQE